MLGSTRSMILALALCACGDDDAPSPSLDGGTSRSVPDAAAPTETAEELPRDATVVVARDASVTVDATLPVVSVDAGVDVSKEEDAGCGELTYENFGQEFLYTWCQSCHGQMEPKFHTQELAQLHAIEIRAETVDSERMPAGGGALYLRKPQREMLGRWLECGAP